MLGRQFSVQTLLISQGRWDQGSFLTNGAAVEGTTVPVVIWLGQDVPVEMACPASELGDSQPLCTIRPGSLGWSLLQILSPVTMPGGGAGGPHRSSMASPTSL